MGKWRLSVELKDSQNENGTWWYTNVLTNQKVLSTRGIVEILTSDISEAIKQFDLSQTKSRNITEAITT